MPIVIRPIQCFGSFLVYPCIMGSVLLAGLSVPVSSANIPCQRVPRIYMYTSVKDQSVEKPSLIHLTTVSLDRYAFTYNIKDLLERNISSFLPEKIRIHVVIWKHHMHMHIMVTDRVNYSEVHCETKLHSNIENTDYTGTTCTKRSKNKGVFKVCEIRDINRTDPITTYRHFSKNTDIYITADCLVLNIHLREAVLYLIFLTEKGTVSETFSVLDILCCSLKTCIGPFRNHFETVEERHHSFSRRCVKKELSCYIDEDESILRSEPFSVAHFVLKYIMGTSERITETIQILDIIVLIHLVYLECLLIHLVYLKHFLYIVYLRCKFINITVHVKHITSGICFKENISYTHPVKQKLKIKSDVTKPKKLYTQIDTADIPYLEIGSIKQKEMEEPPIKTNASSKKGKRREWLNPRFLQPGEQVYQIYPATQTWEHVLERIQRGEIVPPQESMRYEHLRAMTFHAFPSSSGITGESFARAGLYYANNADEVVCYCCKKRFSEWNTLNDPMEIHKRNSPQCKFFTHNSDVNVPELPETNVTEAVSLRDNDVQVNGNATPSEINNISSTEIATAVDGGGSEASGMTGANHDKTKKGKKDKKQKKSNQAKPAGVTESVSSKKFEANGESIETDHLQSTFEDSNESEMQTGTTNGVQITKQSKTSADSFKSMDDSTISQQRGLATATVGYTSMPVWNNPSFEDKFPLQETGYNDEANVETQTDCGFEEAASAKKEMVKIAPLPDFVKESAPVQASEETELNRDTSNAFDLPVQQATQPTPEASLIQQPTQPTQASGDATVTNSALATNSDTRPTVGASSKTPGTGTDVTNASESPKYPQYSTKDSRKRSFESCAIIEVSTERLSEAGFFFAGTGDCTRCFQCGIGLRHWAREDDPWVEHTRFSLKCPFVRNMKGAEFVHIIALAVDYSENLPDDIPQANTAEMVVSSSLAPVMPGVSTEVSDTDLTNLLRTTAAQQAAELGHSTEIIKRALAAVVRRRGRAGVTKTNILEEIGNLARADITNSGLSSDMIARINLSTPSDQDPTNLARSTSDFMSTQTGNHITVATDCPGKSSRSNYYSMPSRNTMSEAEIEERKRQLQEENENLRMMSICCVCKYRDVCMVFLPCGHLITCETCASTQKTCRICNHNVKGTIRTFRQ